MDWTSLIGPAVVAAVISGIVATVGFFVNRSTSLTMHAQKLGAERDLVERKINADIELSKQKFAFEKESVAWRRRYDLAEQILASAYQAQEALRWARVQVVLQGEGETREAQDGESERLRKNRNSAFVPIERLAQQAKAFADLQTAQDAAAAHFGQSVVVAIDTLMNEHRRISLAAQSLIEHAHWNEDRSGSEQLIPFRQELWGVGAGKAQQRINDAIEQLEARCKPALLAAGPT